MASDNKHSSRVQKSGSKVQPPAGFTPEQPDTISVLMKLPKVSKGVKVGKLDPAEVGRLVRIVKVAKVKDIKFDIEKVDLNVIGNHYQQNISNAVHHRYLPDGTQEWVVGAGSGRVRVWDNGSWVEPPSARAKAEDAASADLLLKAMGVPAWSRGVIISKPDHRGNIAVYGRSSSLQAEPAAVPPATLGERHQRSGDPKGTPSTQMSKLLKAFGIDAETMPKKDLEKGWIELRGAFRSIAREEGLVAWNSVLGEHAYVLEEQSHDTPVVHEPGLEAAVREGAEFRTAVLNRADMLGAAGMAKALGITRQAVWARRRAKQILGLSSGRTVRYPEWQMAPNIADFMPTILETLGSLGDWAIYLFMTQPNPILDGVPPLNALLAGEGDRVMAAVRAYSVSMA